MLKPSDSLIGQSGHIIGIRKIKKQAGAELCQAQPQAVLTGFPLASG